MNFRFHPRSDGSTLITWRDHTGAGHALIHDAEQARDLAAANLPGAVSQAARAYLERNTP